MQAGDDSGAAVTEIVTSAAAAGHARLTASGDSDIIIDSGPGERVRCDALSFVYAVGKLVPLDVRLEVFVPMVARLSRDSLFNVRQHCPWVLSALADATSRQVADEVLVSQPEGRGCGGCGAW